MRTSSEWALRGRFAVADRRRELGEGAAPHNTPRGVAASPELWLAAHEAGPSVSQVGATKKSEPLGRCCQAAYGPLLWCHVDLHVYVNRTRIPLR